MQTAVEGEHGLLSANTCSVTELADKKSRQVIRRLHHEHPQAKIIVTGCYAQLKPETVAQIEGGLGAWCEEKANCSSIFRVEATRRITDTHILHTPIGEVDNFLRTPSQGRIDATFPKGARWLWDYQCSYCTIPRREERSRNGAIREIVIGGASGSGGRKRNCAYRRERR